MLASWDQKSRVLASSCAPPPLAPELVGARCLKSQPAQLDGIFPSGETRIYLGFVIGLLLLLAEAATQAFQLVSAVPADVIAPNPRRTFRRFPLH
jgi:hypothetical protein